MSFFTDYIKNEIGYSKIEGPDYSYFDRIKNDIVDDSIMVANHTDHSSRGQVVALPKEQNNVASDYFSSQELHEKTDAILNSLK